MKGIKNVLVALLIGIFVASPAFAGYNSRPLVDAALSILLYKLGTDAAKKADVQAREDVLKADIQARDDALINTLSANKGLIIPRVRSIAVKGDQGDNNQRKRQIINGITLALGAKRSKAPEDIREMSRDRKESRNDPEVNAGKMPNQGTLEWPDVFLEGSGEIVHSGYDLDTRLYTQWNPANYEFRFSDNTALAIISFSLFDAETDTSLLDCTIYGGSVAADYIEARIGGGAMSSRSEIDELVVHRAYKNAIENFETLVASLPKQKEE